MSPKLPIEHKEIDEPPIENKEIDEMYGHLYSSLSLNALRKLIRSNYVNLSKDLESNKIIGWLFQEEVIDWDDKEEIDSLKTRKRKATKILDIVLELPDIENVHKFIEVIMKIQPHLLKLNPTQC